METITDVHHDACKKANVMLVFKLSIFVWVCGWYASNHIVVLQLHQAEDNVLSELPEFEIQLIKVAHVPDHGSQELIVAMGKPVQLLLKFQHRDQPLGPEYIFIDPPMLSYAQESLIILTEMTLLLQKMLNILEFHIICSTKLFC